MRLLGAALVLLSALSAAHCYSAGTARRVAALREMDAALAHMRAELSMRLSTLPELAALLAESEHGTAQQFFSALESALAHLGEESFPALWRKCVNEQLNALRASERDEMLRLGESLGRYELGEQLSALDLCRAQLNTSAEHAASALPDQKRLAYGLSAAAGGMLCILLL